MSHGELVNRVDDDPNLGPCISTLNVRHHDEEEVRCAQCAPYLRFFEMDHVGLVAKMHLEFKEASQTIDGIGSHPVLRAKVDDLVSVSSEHDASELHTDGLFVERREAGSRRTTARRFRVSVGLR